MSYFYPHSRTCILILERWEGREKERERNIDVREKHQSGASHKRPDQGPNLQCALTRNRTGDLLLCSMMPNQLSHTGQSSKFFLKNVPHPPWLVWLSGLSAGLQTKGMPVQFPVRTHAWVAGQVPSRGHVRGNHTVMFLSLPFPLSKINK